MSVIDLSRRAGESELAYIKRIGEAKDNGVIDSTWSDLANIFNKNLREKGESYSESAYRKKYASIKQIRNEFSNHTDQNSEELIELRRELEKEKIKLRDERNAYNKLIREEARKESYKEQFINAIEESAGKHPLEYDKSKSNYKIHGNTTIVVPLTDIHAGIQINNTWNEFDSDILKNMLIEYLNNIEEIAIRHGSTDVVVLASELISGLIHPTLRVQNNQDLIDQFMIIVEYMCDFLSVLSEKFSNIKFYVAPGNHGRINPKKEDGLSHENMDCLIVPFMKAKMQNYDNVYFYDNVIDSGIVTTTINNQKLVFVHGDKDDLCNVTKNMSRLLGYIPDIIVLGHRHYNAYTTDGYTKIIQSGSFVGPDEYAVNKRLVGRPEQAVFIVSEKGLECVYDVKL